MFQHKKVTHFTKLLFNDTPLAKTSALKGSREILKKRFTKYEERVGLSTAHYHS